MTDIKKLIELLEDTLHEWECDAQPETLSQIAEHLLESGVIVPPCKVGDTVWYIEGGYYRKTNLKAKPITVTEISQKEVKGKLQWAIIANGTRYKFTSIGKTVFLTREEAEKALKEREANG